ncbi:MAG: hypothetical protein ABUS47_15385 [Steroidobacter sp.]
MIDYADSRPTGLQWAQSNRLGNRDWLPANANAHSFSDTRSLIGEALRIQVTVKVNDDVTLHKEWVGRITGDHQNPTLTYRWTQNFDSCTKSNR